VKLLKTLIKIESVPAFAGLSEENLIPRINLYISRLEDDEAYNSLLRERGLCHCLVHAGVQSIVAESFVGYLECICAYFGLEHTWVFQHCTVSNWVEQLIFQSLEALHYEAGFGASPGDSESSAEKVLVLTANKYLTANIRRPRTTRLLPRVVRVPVIRQLEPLHAQQGLHSLAR
jgi:hypothetical protein